MSMLPVIIVTIVLAVLYGFFWHNQPANERNSAGGDDNHEDKLRAALGLRRPGVPATKHKLPKGQSVRGKDDTTKANGSTEQTTAHAKEASQANPIIPLKDEISAHSC